jgi:hypothetical protein
MSYAKDFDRLRHPQTPKPFLPRYPYGLASHRLKLVRNFPVRENKQRSVSEGMEEQKWGGRGKAETRIAQVLSKYAAAV